LGLVKDALRGTHFEDDEQHIIEAVRKWLRRQDKSWGTGKEYMH
jgi:hypothetical protein